jgi:hypothetical protein
MHQNYIRDLLSLRFGRVDDGTLVFSRASPTAFVEGAPQPQG